MTDAPWWTNLSLTYATQAATITFTEDPPVDWELLEFELLTASVELPGGTVAGIGGPAGAIDTAYLEPGAVPLSGYAKDQVTGQIVDVQPDSSGVAPLIPYPGHPGSRVNPSWVIHKSEQAIGQYHTNSTLIPPPDKVTIFSGTGGGPTWEEVWAWTTAEQRSKMTFIADGQTIRGAELNAAVDIASASVIKALGGMINHSVAVNAAVQLAIARRLDSLQLVTYGAVVSLMHDIANAQDVNRFLALEVVPNLQAQIKNLRESIPIQIEQAIQANNIRIRDAWITPLRTDVAAERTQRVQADQSIIQRVPGIVRSLAPSLLAPALAGIAGLATRVGTLEGEAERCGRPICQLLGPQSPLGKLLKALNLAADAALLAWLLGKNEQQIAELLTETVGHIVNIVDTISTDFVDGGETIGATITSAVGKII